MACSIVLSCVRVPYVVTAADMDPYLSISLYRASSAATAGHGGIVSVVLAL